MGTLIYSMINGKRYDQVLDLKTIKSALEVTNEQKYKEEAEECSENYIQKTSDSIQKKTFNRILKDKPKKPHGLIGKRVDNLEYGIQEVYITKNCPHCNSPTTCPIDTKYTICGYANSATGYDWKGCGKDWCFECGKMLCKSWDSDKLLLQMNRFHDVECCERHANSHNKDYIQNYCHCTNKNVNRTLKSIL
jgi:hypothetical protein